MTFIVGRSALLKAFGTALASSCAIAVAGDIQPETLQKGLAQEVTMERGDMSGFSATTMKAISGRIAKVDSIVKQIRQHEAINDSRLVSLNQSLLGASDSSLDAASSAVSFKGAMAAIRNSGTKTLGELTRDFVFYPIVPCRLLDSRANATPLLGGVPYLVDFDGGNPGNAAGCTFGGVATQVGGAFGTPISRAALLINLTVTGTAGPGFIQARPVGSGVVTSTQNFTTGQTVANMAVVQDAGTAAEIELFASTTTHAIVDVLGMFAPPAATALDCTQQTVDQTVAAGVRAIQTVACPAGYSVTGGGVDTCGPSGGCINSGQAMNASAPSGNSWFASIANTSAGDKIFTFYAKCCRVPGR